MNMSVILPLLNRREVHIPDRNVSEAEKVCQVVFHNQITDDIGLLYCRINLSIPKRKTDFIDEVITLPKYPDLCILE